MMWIQVGILNGSSSEFPTRLKVIPLDLTLWISASLTLYSIMAWNYWSTLRRMQRRMTLDGTEEAIASPTMPMESRERTSNTTRVTIHLLSVISLTMTVMSCTLLIAILTLTLSLRTTWNSLREMPKRASTASLGIFARLSLGISVTILQWRLERQGIRKELLSQQECIQESLWGLGWWKESWTSSLIHMTRRHSSWETITSSR